MEKQIYDFLSEYGYIAPGIGLCIFAVFWLSIPWYLSECSKTDPAIRQIRKYGFLTQRDLDTSATSNNLEGLNYAFGQPHTILFADCYKNPAFRKHIEELRTLRKFYLKAIIVIFALFILILGGRIYYISLDKKFNPKSLYKDA